LHIHHVGCGIASNGITFMPSFLEMKQLFTEIEKDILTGTE
jgi:hypothetical protein